MGRARSIKQKIRSSERLLFLSSFCEIGEGRLQLFEVDLEHVVGRSVHAQLLVGLLRAGVMFFNVGNGYSRARF